jgi:type II secretory pathway component GspD/PulD (secretin)
MIVCAVAVALFWPTPADAGRMMEVFEIHYSSPKEMEGPVRMLLSPAGKLSVDESSSYIIVNDERENVEEIRALIARLDKAPKSLVVEVEFVEESHIKSLGADIKWRLAGTGWMIGTFPGQSAGLSASARAGLSGAKGTKKQFLRLLENRQGRIFVGESVPFTDYFIHYGQGHGYITGNTVYKNVGTSFNVTAKTASDNKIMVSLEPEVSSRERGTNSFQVKNAAVSALLDDPGTLVIGGNDEDKESFGANFLSGLDGRAEKSRFAMILTVRSEK